MRRQIKLIVRKHDKKLSVRVVESAFYLITPERVKVLVSRFPVSIIRCGERNDTRESADGVMILQLSHFMSGQAEQE
jgi:hypothetical protein